MDPPPAALGGAEKLSGPTVFFRVYSEVMLSSSSMVKADRSRLQPWHSSTLHWW